LRHNLRDVHNLRPQKASATENLHIADRARRRPARRTARRPAGRARRTARPGARHGPAHGTAPGSARRTARGTAAITSAMCTTSARIRPSPRRFRTSLNLCARRITERVRASHHGACAHAAPRHNLRDVHNLSPNTALPTAVPHITELVHAAHHGACTRDASRSVCARGTAAITSAMCTTSARIRPSRRRFRTSLNLRTRRITEPAHATHHGACARDASRMRVRARTAHRRCVRARRTTHNRAVSGPDPRQSPRDACRPPGGRLSPSRQRQQSCATRRRHRAKRIAGWRRAGGGEPQLAGIEPRVTSAVRSWPPRR
jgi:hypothetical protein